MKKQDYAEYILPVGLVIGAYFLLKNFGLFGGGAAAQNASGIQTTTAAGVTAALQQAKAAGDVATLNASQASAIATNIYNAGVSDPVDQDTIQNQIIQANSLTDLLNIIQAFGTKQAGGTMCSLFGGFLSATCGTYDLPGWVRASCDATHLSSINTYFSNQGINYTF
jgi:hypothetical protein